MSDQAGGTISDGTYSVSLELLKEDRNVAWKRHWTLTHWMHNNKENNNSTLKNSLHLR